MSRTKNYRNLNILNSDVIVICFASHMPTSVLDAKWCCSVWQQHQTRVSALTKCCGSSHSACCSSVKLKHCLLREPALNRLCKGRDFTSIAVHCLLLHFPPSVQRCICGIQNPWIMEASWHVLAIGTKCSRKTNCGLVHYCTPKVREIRHGLWRLGHA